MPRYVLHHRHEAHECGVVFASFKGHNSPLRRQPRSPRAAPADTQSGGPWKPPPRQKPLALLPPYVAERTAMARVSAVDIP